MLQVEKQIIPCIAPKYITPHNCNQGMNEYFLKFYLCVSDPDNFLVDLFGTLVVSQVSKFHHCSLKLSPALACLLAWLPACIAQTCPHFCRGWHQCANQGYTKPTFGTGTQLVVTPSEFELSVPD